MMAEDLGVISDWLVRDSLSPLTFCIILDSEAMA
jgi:hypothetical protein